MKVEVEFTFDLDFDHPDWPEETSCQLLISEDELPLHKDMMKRLRITPSALKEVFAEARELSKDIKPSDRVRIVADRAWFGLRYGRSKNDFVIGRGRYSPLNDPMLQGVEGGLKC